MKRLFRYVCVLLAAFTLLSLVTVAGAAGTQVIDASHTSAGYVTVSYTSSARLKVGIQYGSGKTAYRDCPSGTTSFALDQGNGTYTVSVCQNLSGTSYRVVASQTMRVTIDSANAPYLISTSEVPFTAGDAVTTKAAELCKNAKTDEEKVVAIYNFIAGRYTYDEALADRVRAVKMLLPYDKLGLAAPMRERGSVQVEEYREDGLYLEGIVKTEDLHCFEGYLV